MSGLSLNFGEVEGNREVTGANGVPQITRISPGIHDNITLTGVEEGTTPNGKGIIKVSFLSVDGSVFIAELSTEGGAVPYTLKKLKHMLTKVVDEDTANKTTTVEGVNKILTGQKFRLKVCGEEYVNNKGETRIKATLGLPNFAESAGLEKEFSKLRFDPTNNYDIKRLPKAPMQELSSTNLSVIDDMPF
jgi:hypothetical protein